MSDSECAKHTGHQTKTSVKCWDGHKEYIYEPIGNATAEQVAKWFATTFDERVLPIKIGPREFRFEQEKVES